MSIGAGDTTSQGTEIHCRRGRARKLRVADITAGGEVRSSDCRSVCTMSHTPVAHLLRARDAFGRPPTALLPACDEPVASNMILMASEAEARLYGYSSCAACVDALAAEPPLLR